MNGYRIQLCRSVDKSTHRLASAGFEREAVEPVLRVQRPHRLAADSLIRKRAKERDGGRMKERMRKGVAKKCEFKGEACGR